MILKKIALIFYFVNNDRFVGACTRIVIILHSCQCLLSDIFNLSLWVKNKISKSFVSILFVRRTYIVFVFSCKDALLLLVIC